MTDKLQKALAKLSAKEKSTVANILKKLISGDVDGLDVKYLKGNTDIYRVRKGNIRIIYTSIGGEIKVLTISRRNEKTYKNY